MTAQFPLLITGDSTPQKAIAIVVGRIIYQFVINGIFAVDNYLQNKVSNTLKLEVEQDIFLKISSLSQEQIENPENNKTITRIREDIGFLGSVSRDLSTFVGEFIGFIAAIASLFFIEPLLGVVVFLLTIPLVFLEVKQAKWRRDSYDKTGDHYIIKYNLRWYMIDSQYIPEIKLINGLGSLIRIYKHHERIIITETERIQLKSLKLKIINDFTQLMVLLGTDIWLVFRAAAGNTGLDTILFARNLFQGAVNSSGIIAGSTRDLSEGIVYLGDLQHLFEMQPSIADGDIEIKPKDELHIEFKDVSFRYPNGKSDVIKNVSFEILPDEKVALVGLNGAGKSTLIKLLVGEYVPTEGVILVNGRPLNDYRQSTYTDHISVLMQEILIIHSLTIRENLLAGNERVSEEKVLQALNDVGMLQKVKKSKKGLDSRLSSSFKDGTKFSGGQMQRLAIARSLLKNADLLILDEPTSAVDARFEQDIFNTIFSRGRQATLIVSHRFSTVRRANKIMVLNEGEITSSGSHEDLLKNDELYQELFNKQAEGYR